MFWRPFGMPSHNYERYQWRPGRQGLYESNYVKANSPDGKRAVWLKHNILAWKDPKKEPLVELWCILFTRGEAPQVLKQEIPASRVVLDDDRVGMQGEGILFRPNRTATTITDNGRWASWDIEMEDLDCGPGFVHFPYAGMYEWGFPKKKVITSSPLMRWNGILTFRDQEIPIENWIGFRNHNWGTEHAHCYAYGNCNHFPDAPGVIFDGFSAKIRLGLLKSPYLSMAMIRLGEDDLPMNRLGTVFRSKANLRFPRWELQLQNENHKVQIIQEGEPVEFSGLPYHHPDGKLSYCYNTKWARTTLHIEDAFGKRQRFESDFGELEFLYPKPLKDVHLYPSK